MSVLKSTKERLKTFRKPTNKQAYSTTKVAVLMVTFFLYLFLGAIMFRSLESEHEQTNFNDVIDRLGSFYYNHKHCMDPDDFAKIIEVVAKACEDGMHELERPGEETMLNSSTLTGKWDFVNAFFFSATVVTTIGYGRLAPRTREGRNACILYALLGIPLTALLLNEVGHMFKYKAKRVVKKISNYLEKILRNKTFTSFATWLVTFLLVYILIICLPAFIFTYTEGWSYRDAHYFCFITLTTIGFGDHVVGTNRRRQIYSKPWSRWIFKILTTLYLLFGLSVLAIVFNTFASGGESKLAELRKRRQDQNRRVLEATNSEVAPPYDAINTQNDKDEHSNVEPMETNPSLA